MKKFLLPLLCLLFMAATAGAETYTHTFANGELTTDGGTVTLSDIEWTSSTATSIDWNAQKGIQIGSKNSPNESYTLSTSGFEGCTIKSITVNSSIANSGDAKITITAGNQTSEAFTPGTSDAAYTFDCDDTTGNITINWTATKRAYYVKSITIEYTPDASTVTIPTPEFKTPAVIYADEVKNVTVETDDQSAVIYYTTDGTDPVYEDYVNETGSTKCSKYYVMYFNLTETTTIKAIAVKVDGEAAFKSGIAEQTYIVSPTVPYIPASNITSGSDYAIIAADSAATYYYEDGEYGYLPTKTATDINGKYTETVECAGLTFTAADGGYTIKDDLGRYIYRKGTYTNFNFADEKPADGAVWSVSFDNEGYATIANDGYTVYYSTKYGTYGCYPADKVTEEHVLPKLFKQHQYPTYTIEPANGSRFDRLETITVTCSEGIAATSDFKIEVEDFKTAFTVTQTDKNTLTFTAAEPLTTYNNKDLNVNITQGDIILNPDVMEMLLPIQAKYGRRTLVKYVLEGNAPAAVIEEVSPANGSTVEQLSVFVFSFSYFASHTDNTEIKPLLHLEGSEEIIELEQTVTKEDGKNIGMQQAALKTIEPVLDNGTYILEIPTGYFCDGNGKDIEGITLKYIVQNNTGIDEVKVENGKVKGIYDLTGRRIENITNAGIYIVNGKKTLVK